MSLRHALLGLLAGQPMSGYELSRWFEHSVANVWPASHSQIYPELGKLERNGLIEQVAAGPRRRKTYAVSDDGRAEVRRWLTETEPDHATRSEPLLRGFFLWLLDPQQAAAYLRREAGHHAARLARYEAVAARPQPGEPAANAARIVLEAGIRAERARLDWALWAAEQYEREVIATPAQ